MSGEDRQAREPKGNAGGASEDPAGDVQFPSIDAFPVEDEPTPVPKVTRKGPPTHPPVHANAAAMAPAQPAPLAPGPESRRQVAESLGQSSASYSSSRPHHVAPPQIQVTDAPPVIVEAAEPMPGGNAKETMRLADAPPRSAAAQYAAAAAAQQTVRLPWTPSPGAPVSQGAPVPPIPAGPITTRRGPNPTMLLRPKGGAGTAQKIMAFFGVLLAVIAIGAVVFYVIDSTTRPKGEPRKPQKVGLYLTEPGPSSESPPRDPPATRAAGTCASARA